MKITIESKPSYVANMNFGAFRKQFSKEFDIKKAVFDNLVVPKENEEEIKNAIFYGTDWTNLISIWNSTNKQEEVAFLVYQCEFNEVTLYNPELADRDNGTLTLKNVTSQITDFLVINTVNMHIAKHLEYLLSQRLVDYINFDWNVLIDLEKE